MREIDSKEVIMLKVTLTPKPEFDFPADLDNITPDNFEGKDVDEIEKVPVYKGSKEMELGELFEVESEDSGEDVEIVIDGDIPNGKRLGQDMTKGKIIVKGEVGMYAGAFMEGGKMEIEGDADSWVGQKMSDGEIIVKGDANDFVGSTFRGEWEGMTGGELTVEGDAGDQVGEFLAGGKIKIEGDVGIHSSYHMKSGTLVINGDAGKRVGGQMEDGDIVIMGELESVLPGFSFEEEITDIEVDGAEIEGEFLKFVGDGAEEGEGNLYLNKGLNEGLLPA